MENKMKSKLSIITIILVFAVSTSFAQLERSTAKVGTTAATFLKISAGARTIGMGGAFAAMENDIYSIYWNPAGVSRISGSGSAAFNHANWLADMSFDFAALTINMGDFGSVGLSLTSFSVPEEKVRTFENPEGDGRYWDASSLALGVTYARNLTENFSIGFNMKYIRDQVWDMSASSIALDVGTLYTTPFNGLRIGASISNFGTKMKLEGRNTFINIDPDDNSNTGPNNIPAQYRLDAFDIPLSFRVGLAMELIRSRFLSLTAAVDAVHPNDNTEYVNSGIEMNFNNNVFLRAGYKSLFLRDSEQGLTFGFGLSYPIVNDIGININYGFADYGRLKNVQFFDVVIKF